MYYLTIYNEPMIQPEEPAGLDVEGLLKGLYLLKKGDLQGAPKANILASGVAVAWALEAQELLATDWGVSAEVWSVTSWNELRRDGVEAERHNFLNPNAPARIPYVTEKLSNAEGPCIAVSDFMHSVQDQIRAFVPGPYLTLGADGFGFSDTRPAARRHFAIDGPSVAARVLQQLAREGSVAPDALAQAISRYQLHDVRAGTSGSAGGEA
jgi:pyruvate dehydrogenase E1 component